MERDYVRYHICHVPEQFAGLFKGMEPPAFFVKVLSGKSQM